MRRVVQFFALTLVVAFLCDGSARAATLTGDSIQARYFFPDTSTVYASATQPAPFTVGAGVDGTMIITDAGGQTTLNFDFDVSSLVITLITQIPNPTWDSATQNGPAFTILSGGNPFIGVDSVTTSMIANAGPIQAFLQGGVLFINWAGMTYKDLDTVTVNFATPLPAALPLFAGGLGAFGLLGWRRKRQRLRNRAA